MLYRAMINQPSSNLPFCKLHGKICIADDNKKQFIRVYFTEGNVHSMLIDRTYIDRIFLSSAENDNQPKI